MLSCWFEHKDFKIFVVDAWNLFNMEGLQAYVLKENFKLLILKFNVWNVEVFDWLNLRIDSVVKSLM